MELARAEAIAREVLAAVPDHHGFAHVARAVDFARQIAVGEKFGLETSRWLAIAAWLHDLGRGRKDLLDVPGATHAHVSAELAEPLLVEAREDPAAIRETVAAISGHADLGSALTQLGRALKDADMLDGLGFRGVERNVTEKLAEKFGDFTFDDLQEAMMNHQLPQEMWSWTVALLREAQVTLGWYGLLTTPTARRIGLPLYWELVGLTAHMRGLLDHTHPLPPVDYEVMRARLANVAE